MEGIDRLREREIVRKTYPEIKRDIELNKPIDIWVNRQSERERERETERDIKSEKQ